MFSLLQNRREDTRNTFSHSLSFISVFFLLSGLTGFRFRLRCRESEGEKRWTSCSTQSDSSSLHFHDMNHTSRLELLVPNCLISLIRNENIFTPTWKRKTLFSSQNHWNRTDISLTHRLSYITSHWRPTVLNNINVSCKMHADSTLATLYILTSYTVINTVKVLSFYTMF